MMPHGLHQSHEIVEIMADIVKRSADGCRILLPTSMHTAYERDCPPINYQFGNATGLKEFLDDCSISGIGTLSKFPLIYLFCPINEERNNPDYYSKAKVNLIICCSTRHDWTNEERLVTSFQSILRPIYRRFLEELNNDDRLDFGYKEYVRHNYSENYSYGKYGAYTSDGKKVSEPIDAINITNLEIIVKQPTCR